MIFYNNIYKLNSFIFILYKMSIQFNPEQLAIINAPLQKHIRICAGAGSGKTTTIVYRVQYLIKSNINPKKILICTFNVDAANVIKSKIENIIGKSHKITIGTIDSIGYKFIKQYSTNAFRSVQEYSTEFLNILNSDNAEKILDQYDYVFFDEFQDASSIQFDILKRFSIKSFLTVIGDDAQNIYQWRGSQIEYILNFDKYFPMSITFLLQYSYRSTPEIINFALNSIANNTDQIKKTMIPIKSSLQSPILPSIISLSKSSHNAYIIDRLRYYISINIPLEEICILSRNNYGLESIEEDLIKADINYISLISTSKSKIMSNHIVLSTIHKVKGLEFDTVFLIGCDDMTLPSSIDPITIQEERRLFYVGITRPRSYLEITFTTNYCSRFIGEIKSTLYNFINFDPKFFNHAPRQTYIFETSLEKLLSNINVEKLRSLDILPEIKPISTKIHSSTKINSYIKDHNLLSDYEAFLQSYINVRLNIKDSYHNAVLNHIKLPQHEYLIFRKYHSQIYLKIHKFLLEKKTYNIGIKDLDKTPTDLPYIKQVESKDVSPIVRLSKQILEQCLKLNCTIYDLYITLEDYVPEFFLRELKNISTQSISNEDIYHRSLCKNIFHNKRRLLYKNVMSYFVSNKNIFEYIDKWIKDYLTENSNLLAININNTLYNIHSNINFYDKKSKSLIMITLSTTDNFELILYNIGKISLLKLNPTYSHLLIENIRIYNPVEGSQTDIPLNKWNSYKNFLANIDKNRSDTLSKIETKPIHKSVSKSKPTSKSVSKSVSKSIFTPLEISTNTMENDEIYNLYENFQKKKKN